MKKALNIALTIIAVIALLLSAFAIVNYMKQSKQNDALNDELKNNHETIKPDEPIEEIKPEESEEPTVPEVKKTLDEINSDYIGWIDIAGTSIDYPVVQTKDNQFYLDHDFNKDKSPYGTAFLDHKANIKQSQNLVVYAHNMSDGQMFTDLTKYEDEEFYKMNSVVNFRDKTYDIFSVNKINVNSDVGLVIQYTNPDYFDQDYFLNWIEEIREVSLIQSDITIKENDRILTLSTCSYEDEDERFVVFALERNA